MLQQDGLDRLRARGGQSASVADQLMVAHKHYQPARASKTLHDAKHGSVRGLYFGQAAVLPQFVAVTDFDVGIALAFIVAQSVHKERLVAAKGICRAIVPSMQIGKEYKP